MNIAICGFGRAGKSLAKMVIDSKKNNLVMVICRNSSKNANQDIGELLCKKRNGIRIVPIEKAVECLEENKVDVVIDFSHHDMAEDLLRVCGEEHMNLVICTTNHTIEEISQFQQMADRFGIGIVYCPNLTLGINLLMEFIKKISTILPYFDFDVVEKHPKDKKKPTETAMMLAQMIGKDRTEIHSIRMDGYIGFHEVTITDGIERITLCHESLSRQAFANGAILAAEFIEGKTGFFLMKDVINELEENANEEACKR